MGGYNLPGGCLGCDQGGGRVVDGRLCASVLPVEVVGVCGAAGFQEVGPGFVEGYACYRIDGHRNLLV
jgi:hypothetical protein